MQRISTTLALLVLFCSTVFAQRPEGWQASFDKGIAALTEGRHDEGIDAFKLCLELQEEDATCAYNIACGYSLKSEMDPGIEWLTQAIDWGFAREQQNVDLAEKTDTDLSNLRKDARFTPLMESMKKDMAVMLAAIEAEWKEPLIIKPAGHETMKDLGALIVLHDAGSSKKEVSESYWKAVASELHLVLVIPSGKMSVGRTPEKGMLWFSDFEAFTARYWDAEKSIDPAIAAVKKMKNVDSKRVFMAGQGQGGVVAFNAVMRAPRLYAGVLTVDAPIITDMTKSYFPNAISAGVKVRALVNTQSMWGIPKEQAGPYVGTMRTKLVQAKLASEVKIYVLDEAKPNLRKDLIVETLRGIMPAAMDAKATPVEAGSEK